MSSDPPDAAHAGDHVRASELPRLGSRARREGRAAHRALGKTAPCQRSDRSCAVDGLADASQRHRAERGLLMERSFLPRLHPRERALRMRPMKRNIELEERAYASYTRALRGLRDSIAAFASA